MKKIFFLVTAIIFITVCSVRFFSLKKFDNMIQTDNFQVQSQLEDVEQQFILLYNRMLYKNSSKNIHENISEYNELPVKYDYANFDIDLMPIMISGRLILVQTHSIKILYDGLTYEYKCDEQIKSMSYPVLEDSDLVFYIIKFNSNKIIERIPSNKREWILQKIIFTDNKFMEQETKRIEIHESYEIKQLKSEISFFNYENDIINVVLTDNFGKSAIFRITDNGTEIQQRYDGEIIIPNQFCGENLWYIKTNEMNETWLMKDEESIHKINNMVSQGHFINESIIQFVYYDYTQVGKFDLLNGPHIPIYHSNLYLTNENRTISSCYSNYENSLFRDKIITDNILAIF